MKKNKNIWVIIANAETAYIYSITEQHLSFKLIKKFAHQASRSKNIDLVADRPGHYTRRCNKSRGSYQDTIDPKLLEIKHFAQEICYFLEKAKSNNLYNAIIIIAEPNFYGLIKKLASTKLLTAIKYHLAKDYVGVQQKILKNKWLPELYHQINHIFLAETT